jgi:hypothetical protein
MDHKSRSKFARIACSGGGGLPAASGQLLPQLRAEFGMRQLKKKERCFSPVGRQFGFLELQGRSLSASKPAYVMQASAAFIVGAAAEEYAPQLLSTRAACGICSYTFEVLKNSGL